MILLNKRLNIFKTMNFIYKYLYIIIVSCCFLLINSNAIAQPPCNMDSLCTAGETYCTCPADCPCDLLELFYIDFSAFSITQDNYTGEIFVCPEQFIYNYITNINIDNFYLPITIQAGSDCAGSTINNVNINTDNGSLISIDLNNYSNTPVPQNGSIPTNSYTAGIIQSPLIVLELTMADVMNQPTVTFSIAVDDGTGNSCMVEQSLNILATPSFLNPYCDNSYTGYYLGCTDPTACNYDPNAYYDDGSCYFQGDVCDDGDPTTNLDIWVDCYTCFGVIATIPGCTDPNACNFDPTATVDNGSCFFPGDQCDDNDPDTFNDVWVDCNTCAGVLAGISGCTDVCAGNYDPAATMDDGSCFYPNGGNISTADTTAFCENDSIFDFINVDIINEVGTITEYFITDDINVNIVAGPFTSSNIDFNAAPDGNYNIWAITSYQTITFPASGLLADLQMDCNFALSNAIFVSAQFCTIFGCTDMGACNFDPLANQDNSSCIYVTDPDEDCDGDDILNGDDCEPLDPNIFSQPGDPCDDGNMYTIDDTLNAVCVCVGELANSGCMDNNACNYDPTALFDDGSCLYFDCLGVCGGTAAPGDACDDGDPTTTNDIIDLYCNCTGTPSNCLTEPGNLQFTTAGFFGNNSYICYGDNVFVDADDFVMLGNQNIYYVYHNLGPNITAVDLPIPTANIVQYGNFINNGINTGGSTIYVTAFGATNSGSGTPNFSDPCITISNTLVMNMLNPVTIISEENCDGDTGEFYYTFYVAGGLPEQIPGLQYDVTGTFYNGPVDPLNPILIGPIIDGETYEIVAEDDNFCTGELERTILCIKVSIELLAFEGSAENMHNLISWQTATEFNNSHFILKKSNDGLNFEELAIIESLNGTTSQTSSYSYNDYAIESNNAYYKLVDVDLDGNQKDHGSIFVKRSSDEMTTFNIESIYPNPTSEDLNILYNVNSNDAMHLQLYNLLGEVVLSKKLENQNNDNQHTINVSHLIKGVYYLNITLNEASFTEKVIID